MPASSRPARAFLAALVAGPLALLIGCRHLDVVDMGYVGGDRASLVVDLDGWCGRLPRGTVVEVYYAEGGLATRFIADGSGPRTIPDLPPGAYWIRVDARPVGGPVLDTEFAAGPGRAVAIAYDDGGHDRRAAAEVARGVGIALLVTTLIAADVALAILCCGCYRPCLYKIVIH